MKLRLGTRTSLLARAQSREVACALQAAHPDLEIELVGITTAGDRDTSKPLWQMDIVGIFTREIDEKLLAGKIDFAVHSLKDLGTQRPTGLVTAAIPPRAPPYDVVLFRPDIMEILRSGRALNIGTSAPRRNQLVPEFLAKALPQISDPPQINIQTLRGNVDTRVGRLHETGARALDGVVLAFAGLKRLYADEAGQKILHKKLRGVRWMVLPLTTCPGAPGQGALAIETRADDTKTQNIVSMLHHAPTAARIADEMDVLRAHGGGCHQKFGVVSLHLPNMAAPITLVRGHDENGKPVDETRTPGLPNFAGKKIWSGKAWTRKIFDMQRLQPARNDFPAVFAANSRAVPKDINPNARLWTSGTPSWLHLADQGLWVEGAADGFGFDFIREFLAEPVLQLPPLSEWGVYTHSDAAADWQDMHIEATYTLVPNPPPKCIAELQAAEVIMWASGSQFDALKLYARQDAQHVTGPGKTAEHLRKYLISGNIKNLVVMPLFD